MIKNKIPLGTKVAFTATSESTWAYFGDEWRENERQVVKHQGIGGEQGIIGEGMICGVRVLQEGHLEQDTPDYETGYCDPPMWHCTKHVDVYLVAINYAQIVKVQPEDIVLGEAEPDAL